MGGDDLYRFRAEDFARRWENHRRVEWAVNFQVYVGYAAIALSYWYLRDKYDSASLFVQKAFGWGATLAIFLLYGATQYLFLRIQERLHIYADLNTSYLKMLHTLVGAEELPLTLEVKEPKHPRWYAFGVQTILTFFTALGLLAFISAMMPPINNLWVVCGGIVLVLAVYARHALLCH